MKKHLLLLFGALIALPSPARDFEYTYQGQTLTYTVIDETAKTCKVKSGVLDENGDIYVYGDLVLPASPQDGNAKFTLVEIGDDAFYECNVTSVSIPGSVTFIGGNAFQGCNKLKKAEFASIEHLCSIEFEDQSANPLWYAGRLYVGGEEITNVVIPNSVTAIGDYAFSGCKGLQTILIPSSVTSVGSAAFDNCSNLKKSAYPNTINNPFNKGFHIAYDPQGAIIEDGVLYGANKQSVDFVPMEISGEFAIPNSVRSIGDYAFSICDGLVSIAVPNTISSIGKSAFYGCSGLTSITIPEPVVSIGSDAFKECNSLTTVTFNAENCEDFFASFPATIKEVNFGNKVKFIPNSAFKNCTDLTTVTIPNSVTHIGANAFSGSGLTTVTIPNSVTHIGANAFSGSGLTTVTIPNSVVSIGYGAFRVGDGLEKVYFNAENCTSCGEYYYGASFSKIKELHIGEGVTRIPQYCFNGVDILYFNAANCEKCEPLLPQEKLFIGESVISIPDKAFQYSSNITSVTIPNSVVKIGEYSFFQCTGLTSLTIPNSVTEIGLSAFAGCKNLSSLTLGNSLTIIGQLTFQNCSSLTSLTIPNSVSVIDYGAFAGCNGLTSITIPESVTEISGDVFAYGLEKVYFNAVNCETYGNSFPTTIKELYIGEGVKYISGYTFEKCSQLEKLYFNAEDCEVSSHPFPSELQEVYIGNNVKRLSDYIFYCCSGLTSVNIPISVTEIGDCAFANCSGLTSIMIPDSVAHIGNSAFAGCESLTSATIGKSVTAIGLNAFNGCDNLETVYFNAENCESCGEHYATAFPSTLREVYISDEVNLIPDYAFMDCEWLTTLSIGNSVTSIGDQAFYHCYGLSSVVLPESLQTLGSFAFSNCANLTSMIIPNCVESIGSGVFFDCSSLRSVTIGPNVKTIGDDAFYGCSDLERSAYPNNLENPFEGGYTIAYNPEGALLEDGWIYGLDKKEIRYAPSELEGECVLPETIESIDDWAFAYSPELESVTMGNSVRHIGKNTFYSCRWLTSVDMSEALTDIGSSAFENCWNLTSVNIPGPVTTIGENAFKLCQDLSSVAFGNSLTSIGAGAFIGCFGISEVSVPSINDWVRIEFGDMFSNPTYYAYKLNVNGEPIRRVTIPEGADRISGYAFINCNQLVTVTFPSTVQSVGNHAFSGCYALQRGIFPTEESFLKLNYDTSESHITYGNNSKIYVGSSEYSPNTINWPESLTRIPDYAFYGKNNLWKIDIPESVKSIGRGAFGYCSNLGQIKIPDGVFEIEDSTFYACTYMTAVDIPASISYIGKDAFDQCSGLESVKMHDVAAWSQIAFANDTSNPLFYAGRFTIGSSDQPVRHLDLNLGWDAVSPFAFIGAKSLETIRVIASSVGTRAFDGCYSVKALCLSVNDLGEYAFESNWGLENIYCMTETPPAAYGNTFSKYDGVMLYVPQGSVSSYENSDPCWYRFLDVYQSDFANVDEIFGADGMTGVANVLSAKGEGAVEVFNLNGVKVGESTEGLPRGIYLIRQGSKTRKFAI